MLNLLRHDLIWLDDTNTLPWNYPYVITSQPKSISRDMLRVAYQVSVDKSILSRKSWIVSKLRIVRHERPLLLKNLLILYNLTKLNPILEELAILGVTVCVFGSFSWQAITGNIYITSNSDLDLLFYLNEIKLTQLGRIGQYAISSYLSQVYELLVKLEQMSLYRIDGELVFPNGYFINWQEWFAEGKEVLVKTTTAAFLCNKEQVYLWF